MVESILIFTVALVAPGAFALAYLCGQMSKDLKRIERELAILKEINLELVRELQSQKGIQKPEQHPKVVTPE